MWMVQFMSLVQSSFAACSLSPQICSMRMEGSSLGKCVGNCFYSVQTALWASAVNSQRFHTVFSQVFCPYLQPLTQSFCFDPASYPDSSELLRGITLHTFCNTSVFPGQRQSWGRVEGSRNNLLIKWMGARVPSSAHFLNRTSFLPFKVKQWWWPEFSLFTRVISPSDKPLHSRTHPRAETHPPRHRLCNEKASMEISSSDSVANHSCGSVGKQRGAVSWMFAVLYMQGAVRGGHGDIMDYFYY